MTQPPFRVAAEDMLARMQGDKKNRDGRITLILSKGIGRMFVAPDVSESDLRTFLKEKFV
jgi:3-dehydroquinate synthase